jgi:hypothetical protein
LGSSLRGHQLPLALEQKLFSWRRDCKTRALALSGKARERKLIGRDNFCTVERSDPSAFEVFFEARKPNVVLRQQSIAIAKFGRRSVLSRELAFGRSITVTRRPRQMVYHRTLTDCRVQFRHFLIVPIIRQGRTAPRTASIYGGKRRFRSKADTINLDSGVCFGSESSRGYCLRDGPYMNEAHGRVSRFGDGKSCVCKHSSKMGGIDDLRNLSRPTGISAMSGLWRVRHWALLRRFD